MVPLRAGLESQERVRLAIGEAETPEAIKRAAMTLFCIVENVLGIEEMIGNKEFVDRGIEERMDWGERMYKVSVLGW